MRLPRDLTWAQLIRALPLLGCTVLSQTAS